MERPNLNKREIRKDKERDEKMQNEPNFESNAHMPNPPHGSRATGHESRVTNYAKRTQLNWESIRNRKSKLENL